MASADIAYVGVWLAKRIVGARAENLTFAGELYVDFNTDHRFIFWMLCDRDDASRHTLFYLALRLVIGVVLINNHVQDLFVYSE